MKDGYSFSANQESLQSAMTRRRLLTRTFATVRLRLSQVVADSRPGGGDTSVELRSELARASLVYCDCGYAADTGSSFAKINVERGVWLKMCKIHTLSGSIDDVLGFPPHFTCSNSQRLLRLLMEMANQLCALFQALMKLNEVKAEHVW